MEEWRHAGYHLEARIGRSLLRSDVRQWFWNRRMARALRQSRGVLPLLFAAKLWQAQPSVAPLIWHLERQARNAGPFMPPTAANGATRVSLYTSIARELLSKGRGWLGANRVEGEGEKADAACSADNSQPILVAFAREAERGPRSSRCGVGSIQAVLAHVVP